jgi:hypothetical protein
MSIPIAMADPLQRATIFGNVFTRVTLDAAHTGISPDLVSVSRYSESEEAVRVDVQIRGHDTAAVDALAELYDLADDEVGVPSLYIRAGRTVIDGHSIAVRVYCACPRRVVTR